MKVLVRDQCLCNWKVGQVLGIVYRDLKIIKLSELKNYIVKKVTIITNKKLLEQLESTKLGSNKLGSKKLLISLGNYRYFKRFLDDMKKEFDLLSIIIFMIGLLLINAIDLRDSILTSHSQIHKELYSLHLDMSIIVNDFLNLVEEVVNVEKEEEVAVTIEMDMTKLKDSEKSNLANCYNLFSSIYDNKYVRLMALAWFSVLLFYCIYDISGDPPVDKGGTKLLNLNGTHREEIIENYWLRTGTGLFGGKGEVPKFNEILPRYNPYWDAFMESKINRTPYVIDSLNKSLGYSAYLENCKITGDPLLNYDSWFNRTINHSIIREQLSGERNIHSLFIGPNGDLMEQKIINFHPLDEFSVLDMFI